MKLVTAPFDIRDCDLAIVKKILNDFLPENSKVWVFGSRTKGTAKRASDLDLAIDTGRPLTAQENCNLADAFDESDLPYKVDVIDMQTVSKQFRPHVEREKVELDWLDTIF
jgi:predicted nucleotidyltransferase